MTDIFSLTDIADIPNDVTKCLKLSGLDRLAMQVVELLNIAGRPLCVQEIIVGLYRKYGYSVVHRNPFASKLYRLTQNGIIDTVKGKRGYYQLPNIKYT